MTRTSNKDEGARACLRAPMGNCAVYSREYLAGVRNCVVKAWPASGPNSVKREVALTLLADPELRLRVCHLEEILRARQLAARQQANSSGSGSGANQNGCHHSSSPNGAAGQNHHNGIVNTAAKEVSPPPVELQTALADPSFAALFELDPSVNEPDWGMQVLWLNMTQLQKELSLPPPPSPAPPPPPPPAATSASPPHAPPVAPQPPNTNLTAPSSSPGAIPGPAAATAAMPADLPPSTPSAAAAQSALPATAAAQEPTLQTAIEAAFPNHPTSDEDYLSVAACFCLVTFRDHQNLLPPLSLHLRDLAAHLYGCTAGDARLAAAVQRVLARAGTGGDVSVAALSSALTELVAGHRARHVFRQSESVSRKGDRVVSLALEQLMRYGGTGGSGGGGANGANPGSVASSHGATLPLEAWHRAATAAVAAAAAGGGDGAAGTALGDAAAVAAPGDGLPDFLFEYQAPAGVHGRGAATPPPLAARRGSSGRPSGGGAAGGSSSAIPTGSPGGAKAVSAPFDGFAAAAQRLSSQPLSPTSRPQVSTIQGCTSLHHAWSDGAASSLPYPQPSLHLVASEPVPLPLSADVSTHHAGSLSRHASETPHLQRGFSEWPGVGSAGNMYDNSAFGGGAAAVADALASVAAAALAASASPSTAAAAPIGILSASPGGIGAGELHVPQEIAEVWSNAALGGGGGGSAAGLAMMRRMSSSLNASGPGSDVAALGGIFAMSPTHESFAWDRVAARTQPTSKLSTSLGGAGLGGVNRSGTIDLGTFGFGLGYPGVNGGGGGGVGAGFGAGGNMVMGSAPSGLVPPFLHGSSYGSGYGVGSYPNMGFGVGPGGGGGGGNNPGLSGIGLGGSGASSSLNVGNGNGLMDYVSWHSTSADLSSSVGGRSVPLDVVPGGPWLLDRGHRASAGGGGGAGIGAARAFAAGSGGGAAVAAGGVAREAAGGAGAGVITGRSPSLSEESEEAANLMGGLDLDPVAMTLEFIGLDPMDTRCAVTRRNTMLSSSSAASAGGATSVQSKGLIAAAALPKTADGTATVVATSALNGAGGAGGISPHSSFDSSDSGGAVAAANANAAAVLMSWSAMAARSPQAVTPGGVQLAAAAALASAASGGRPYGSLPAQQQPPASPTTATGMTMPARPGGSGGGVMAAGLIPGSAAAAAIAMMGAGGMAAAGRLGGVGGGVDLFAGKVLHPKLTARVREEICHLIRTVPGLKVEDFDDGVMHQLTLKRTEEEAVGALRTLASENLSGIQHMAAYINHIIKNYHLTGMAGAAGGGGGLGSVAAASLPSATVRANSTPVSCKAILQKLPLRVYRRLEEVIAKCSYMEWKHFDAGVVKVMAQLSEIGEEDVFEELELLQSTDLSNVEYMPAYLNKRLNNRLWSRRKMLTSAGAAVAAAAAGAGATSVGPGM